MFIQLVFENSVCKVPFQIIIYQNPVSEIKMKKYEPGYMSLSARIYDKKACVHSLRDETIAHKIPKNCRQYQLLSSFTEDEKKCNERLLSRLKAKNLCL